MSADRPRVALLGYFLEANAFAPVTTGDDFRNSCYLVGDEILTEAAKSAPAMPAELPAFIRAADAWGDWEPVPILCASCEPGGPIDHAFFMETLNLIQEKLAQAGPVDAVYLANHGAMISTETTDPDGLLYQAVRQAVGPEAPLVTTVDLHANISDLMFDSAEAIVSYRTNPHIDMAERAVEAAGLIHDLLAGETWTKRFIRLPLVSPPPRLLTAQGPYADLITAGQAGLGSGVKLVSVVAGFVYADSKENGLAVLTYGQKDRADRLAVELAEQAWADRARFKVRLTPLTEAVARAKAAGLDSSGPAICLADVADNPGGGGRGNTTDIILGLLEAEVDQALAGLFVDPELVAACHRAGPDARFTAQFNSARSDQSAAAFSREVEVLSLRSDPVIGRRGVYAGRSVKLGSSAAIKVNGLTIVAVSRRIQAADPAFFEMHGLSPADFRTVVLKSRGHFRAGFDQFFQPDQIIEVDANGLTTPQLNRLHFKGLNRPIYPLDEDFDWRPPQR